MHYSKANFQRALQRFLLGRAATGALGLVFFVLVLRQLQAEEFGAYTAILAIQAGVAVLATLGIEATLERFLPELRTAGNTEGASQLILLGIAARASVLLLLVLAGLVTMDRWVPVLSLQAYAGMLPLALAWLVMFGLMNTAGAIHEALLNQGTAQFTQALYTLIKIVLFVVLSRTWPEADGLTRVIACESVATLAGLLVSVARLQVGSLRGVLRPRQVWRGLPEGIRARMLAFGAKNYGAQLIMLLYGPDALRLVASSQAGLAQAARFGAVHSLYEYIQRYLPAFMLLRLIRPVFVSRYTANRDFGALNAMGAIVLKINLAVLTPLIVFLVPAGDLVLGTLSKGRYADAGWLLVAYVALLVPMSNQWVVSIIANTTEQNDTQVKAAACALPGIVIGAWLVPSYGIAALVGGAWVSYLLYNLTAVAWLRRAGYPYRPDWRALLLCGLGGAVIAAAAVAAKGVLPPFAMQDLVLGAAAAGLVLALLLVGGLFTPAERQMLTGMLKRRSA
jgi:O-antigen/teichoic acid export membrane protein